MQEALVKFSESTECFENLIKQSQNEPVYKLARKRVKNLIFSRMETYPAMASRPSVTATSAPLKDSIRDMIRLQKDYQLSDELFWEIFNTRVLLNEAIDVNAFVRDLGVPPARA